MDWNQLLLAQIAKELEFIRENTRGLVTGEAQDSGWDVKELGSTFANNLPGRPNNTLDPGDQITILSENDTKGKFVVAILVADNPYVEADIQLKSPTNNWNNTISLNSYTLNVAGINFYNDRIPFNTRYDAANNVYGSVWMPNLELGYHNGIKLIVKNPTINAQTGGANTAATIIEVVVVRILYEEKQRQLAQESMLQIKR